MFSTFHSLYYEGKVTVHLDRKRKEGKRYLTMTEVMCKGRKLYIGMKWSFFAVLTKKNSV